MNTYLDSVTVVRAGLTTGYGGKQVRDWANATRTSIAAAVQPVKGTENDTGRQVMTSVKSLHCAPAGAPTGVDRVEWGGNSYDVEGEPEVHYMSGLPDHVEAVLVLVSEPST